MTTSLAAGRARATSYLDRTWLDHWTVLALVPIHPPTVSDLRAKLVAFMDSDPIHPLSCTLTEQGRRWQPVAPEDRLAHAGAVIVAGGPIDLAEPFTYLDANRPHPSSRAPFKVVVGPESITCYFAHACGDAAVFSPFSVLMALGDIDGLKPLRADAGLGVAVRMFGKEFPTHWRDWWQHARDSKVAHQPAADMRTEPTSHAPAESTATGVVADAVDFAAFNSWRKTNRPGESATALMASAAYRALAAEGIPVDRDGFFTLVDLRRHLPKKHATRPGNLAKSTYVAADMDDPAQVGAALKRMVATARAVPALLSGAVNAARGPRSVDPAGVPETVTMTFNSMMRNPGIEHIPWTDPVQAQYITMSYPSGPDGISVSACAVEDRMMFSASFNSATVDKTAAHRALTRLRDIPAVLECREPLPGNLIPDSTRIAHHATNGTH